MLNLVIKDVLLQKRHFILSFLYILIIIFSFQKVGSIMFPGGVVAFTYMLILTSMTYDDKNKADVMINSLPISRPKIVLSKYISTLVFLFIGVVAYAFFTTVLKLANLPIAIYPVTFEGIAIALLSVSILSGIYFPIFFKVGYAKSNILFMIIFFAFFFGLPQVVNYVYFNRDKGWINSLIQYFSDENKMLAFIFMIVISFFIFFISYLFSVYYYKKREF